VIEAGLERVERQLKAADHEQHRLLQRALKGFPEEPVESENRRLNQAIKTLKEQKSELEGRIKIGTDAAVNVPMLERFIEIMQIKLPDIGYEGKRMALDMLGITVYLDGENVELTGTLDPSIVLTPSEGRQPPSKNTPSPFKGEGRVRVNAPRLFPSGFPPARE
jgi:hypothetical protein